MLGADCRLPCLVDKPRLSLSAVKGFGISGILNLLLTLCLSMFPWRNTLLFSCMSALFQVRLTLAF